MNAVSRQRKQQCNEFGGPKKKKEETSKYPNPYKSKMAQKTIHREREREREKSEKRVK